MVAVETVTGRASPDALRRVRGRDVMFYCRFRGTESGRIKKKWIKE
jgi:hypothetical protein